VKLSRGCSRKYPEEMTIILQHQFWDLVVTEDRLQVGLSFGRHPRTAGGVFAFGQELRGSDCIFPTAVRAFGRNRRMQAAAKLRPSRPLRPARMSAPAPAAGSQDEPAKAGEGAEVVRLDRFARNNLSARSPQRCSVRVRHFTAQWTSRHGSISNFRKQIHPQRRGPTASVRTRRSADRYWGRAD